MSAININKNNFQNEVLNLSLIHILTISPRAILAYVPFVTSLSPDNSQNVIVMYLSCRVR